MLWRSMWPLPVETSRSPLPINASEAFLTPPSGMRSSPRGSQESASRTKSATRSGSPSSTTAACKAPLSRAVAAAWRREPSATGKALGRPRAEAGAQAQEPPAAGRLPGHENRAPALETRSRPSSPTKWRPHEAPTSGPALFRPESRNASAAAPSLSVAAAPKPRGVMAAMRPSAPQARSRGSKKVGQVTFWSTPRTAASLLLGISSRSSRMASENPALLEAWSSVEDKRRTGAGWPMLYSSSWRFSSCQAICSGVNGFSPAAQGPPRGVPSSCGERERRVMGGRDQCGAVTKACSPIATSTMVPKMRKTHRQGRTAQMAANNFHGFTASESQKAAGMILWYRRSSSESASAAQEVLSPVTSP
mmetsp:Transcript_65749/g.166582  ORF Transcript_65749/g.166582 Transcript_65749/m.166582 type:complete len:363 (+) Transcript_65749:617-1705(+)